MPTRRSGPACTAPRLALLAAALVSGCRELPTACTDELGMHLTPAERSLAPGESFTPSLELSSCGGRRRWRPALTWEASDTGVVAVDPASGRTTARAAGAALVTPVEHAVNGEFRYVPVRVTVRP